MAKIILFKDAHFGGGSLTATTPVSSLASEGWNDVVSSVIVIDGKWDLFKDVDFKGTKWTVSSGGGPSQDGTYPVWTDWGGENDVISSLKPN
jgi:hypothetical protein